MLLVSSAASIQCCSYLVLAVLSAMMITSLQAGICCSVPDRTVNSRQLCNVLSNEVERALGDADYTNHGHTPPVAATPRTSSDVGVHHANIIDRPHIPRPLINVLEI